MIFPDKQTIRKRALAARAEAQANAADEIFVRIVDQFIEGPLARWLKIYSHPGQESEANASRDLRPQARANGSRSPVKPGMTPVVIAGYWPFGSEFDTRPLLHALHEEGYDIALPAVHPSDHTLLFRRWTPGLELIPDRMGVLSPPHDAALLEPDIIIVPVVAFDAENNRLGYGKGYYDATLAGLRAQRTILAIGVAYAAQQVEALPYESHDQKLDWILTE